ncbi:hypothetical protein ILUMI_24622 [Ignelater luminosus]|uniref:Cytochrome c oxidase subunit n=1 Tax=Ignelater luminosus TaxID=2038154 RepID=A0A8K0CA51_IGNLU|nr:hypothetical protein ILUMI_24622 [Ignelater luminosus]
MSAILNHAFRRYVSTTLARGAARVEGPSAVSGGHEGGYKIWRNMTFIVAFPAIGLCAVNCVYAHQHEHHDRPEFVKYDYRCMRTKRFPWGDGNHSLFHNAHANALPDGYEEAH